MTDDHGPSGQLVNTSPITSSVRVTRAPVWLPCSPVQARGARRERGRRPRRGRWPGRPGPTFALEAHHDDQREDPLLIALGNARAAREAADREIRHLLAYGRELHGDRPYKLEPLAQASGMTPSGIRTAYTSSEIQTVAHQIGRAPDGRRSRPPAAPEPA
ncbi:hypothetical protein [Streptomyces sp. NBC_01334]|uniref:hypothetical protein n=1 Tax=Streptomyces sp. NBC_01334 TaxID=2903827 RepID=UPI002E167DF2|nr:hypothetical protein OG736_46510 [Streptomyces sp. NBC_01334]